ncbi:MAG: TetR family transcriptional regulator [Candidatus Melainabacteria bacterium]|nr:MAG: TetR family transcriptional regulator [Candidatus Melainabacteria bacterium]
MLEKGYNNTGIMEVLKRTGVPKGSFYHYFESKEDFGLKIIDHFAEGHKEKLDKTLGDRSLSPLSRLKGFCRLAVSNFQSLNCRKGCLIGNLSQEMSDQSEVFRKRLLEIQGESHRRFADCIREGQQRGEISKKYNGDDLAELFLSVWSGAFVRAKTAKTIEPLHAVERLLFEHILVP